MNSSAKYFKLLPLYLGVTLAMLFSSTALTMSSNVAKAPLIQLAHYHGYYNYPAGYWQPQRYHHSNYYWTNGRPYYHRHGYRCHQSCMINRWNGQIVRCVNRCF